MKPCLSGATIMKANLAQDIESAAKAGFEGLEIWAPKLDEYLRKHSPEELKDRLDRAWVKPASVCHYRLVTFGPEMKESIQMIRRAASVAGKIGCSMLLLCPDSPPPGTGEAEAFRKAGATGREVANMCEDLGVSVALEAMGCHPFIPGPSEALRVTAEVASPSFGIALDTFHLYRSGVSPDEVARIPAERVFMVHVSDCQNVPREQLVDNDRDYPGTGVLPVRPMLSALNNNGYKGYLSVELFRETYWDQDPVAVATESKNHLDKVLKSL